MNNKKGYMFMLMYYFMKKILKIIWWIILFLFIWLFISIYISSLFSYTEENFKIPKSFFNTRHYDKNFDSEDNGYHEFIKLLTYLNDNNSEKFSNYDLLSKCFFTKDENVKERYCNTIEKKQIKENQNWLKKMYKYISITQLKFKKLSDKEYIYSFDKNNINSLDSFSSTSLVQFFKVSNYLAYKYVENWEIKKWINILINNQRFLNNLWKKWDFDMLLSLVLILLNRINLEWIDYINENYYIDSEFKNELHNLLSYDDNYNP